MLHLQLKVCTRFLHEVCMRFAPGLKVCTRFARGLLCMRSARGLQHDVCTRSAICMR